MISRLRGYSRDFDGYVAHYDRRGRLHRRRGPAIISPDGHVWYFRHGKKVAK